jgi:hypothetical protein
MKKVTSKDVHTAMQSESNTESMHNFIMRGSFIIANVAATVSSFPLVVVIYITGSGLGSVSS